MTESHDTTGYGYGARGFAREEGPMFDERPHADERPLGVIVSNLWQHAEQLVRKEIQLGMSEANERIHVLRDQVSDDISKLKLELGAKAVGGAVLCGGLLAVMGALILVLGALMPLWVSALIVGVVLVGVGAALLARHIELPVKPDARELIPERTMTSLKQDIHAVKEASRDATR